MQKMAIPDDGQIPEKCSAIIKDLSSIDPTLPIYVDDLGDLDKTLKWSLTQNVLHDRSGSPIFVSTNKLYTTNHAFQHMSVNELLAFVPGDLHQSGQHTKSGVADTKGASAIYVRDYSCELPPRENKRLSEDQKDELAITFGRYQTRRWHEKASGAAFRTWKGAQLGSKASDFKTNVDMGSIYCPPYLSFTGGQVRRKLAEADRKRSQLMTTAMERHIAYFEKVGGRYEHWRYADGWHLGFTDARAFFASRIEVVGSAANGQSLHDDQVTGADKIGALDLWVLKRMKEEDSVSRDRCDFVWEWEHGFRAGIRAFYRLVGI